MTDTPNPFGEEPSEHLLTPPPRKSATYPTEQFAGDSYEQSSNNAFANTDLQFQNFQHTTIDIDARSKSPIGGAIQPEPIGDFGEQPTVTPEPTTPANAHIWNLQYYAPLFNVETKQVLQRIVRSMMPFKFSFIDTISSNPDFYGPFWIATTLVFILAAAGNLYSYFTEPEPTGSEGGLSRWTYNLSLVTVGAATIYGYTLVVPLVLWGVLKYLKVPISLLETICIYGYSLFVYIPVSIVCIIPISIMQWVLIFAACGLSGWFLLSNMIVPIKNASHFKKGLFIMLILGALHVGLALVYKLYFFKVYTKSS